MPLRKGRGLDVTGKNWMGTHPNIISIRLNGAESFFSSPITG